MLPKILCVLFNLRLGNQQFQSENCKFKGLGFSKRIFFIRLNIIITIFIIFKKTTNFDIHTLFTLDLRILVTMKQVNFH